MNKLPAVLEWPGVNTVQRNSQILQAGSSGAGSYLHNTSDWSEASLSGDLLSLTNIHNFAVHPNGEEICVIAGSGSSDPFAHIISTSDWNITFDSFSISGGSTATGLGAKYSPDGNYLALYYDSTTAGPFDNRIAMYDVNDSYNLLWAVTGVDGTQNDFCDFSLDSSQVSFSRRSSPYFTVRNIVTGADETFATTDNLGTTANATKWGDGWLAVGNDDASSGTYRMVVYDTDDGSTLATFATGYEHDRMAKNRTGTLLVAASNSENDHMFVYDPSDWSVLFGPITAPFGNASDIRSIEFNYAGDQLAVFSSSFRPVIYDPSDMSVITASEVMDAISSGQAGHYTID